MAITKSGTKWAAKVEYKPEYDNLGQFPNLTDNYSQTFSYIKEGASVDDVKAFVDALMSLTIYNGAPYKVRLIDTSELVIA